MYWYSAARPNLATLNVVLDQSTYRIIGKCPYKQDYSSICNNLVLWIGKSPFLWLKWLEMGVQNIENLYKDDSELAQLI